MLSEASPKASEASLIECIELRQFVEKYQAAVHRYGNALESPVRAGWITDPEDLNARRQRGAALRYTDAGLAILREEGLEM